MISAELMLERFRKDAKAYIDDVRADMISGIEGLKQFSTLPDSAQTLRVIQSKLRNDILGSLESTDATATVLARFYRYNRDPRVFDVLMESLGALTPADVDAYARTYFTPERRIVTTFWGPSGPKPSPSARGPSHNAGNARPSIRGLDVGQ
jgi:predicted Zn-dependent peptidase